MEIVDIFTKAVFVTPVTAATVSGAANVRRRNANG
jgi:hypothetical protein